MRCLILAFIFVWASVAGVSAQQTRASIPDLVFPTQAVEGAEAIVKLGTVLAKPKGDGPFPAVVIMQTCSGATADQRDWGRRAVNHGYVALIVDSIGPRGLNSNNCNNLPQPRRAADALDARARLRQLSFVDANRIGLLGFSAGANAALYITTHRLLGTQREGYTPFAAVAIFYPGCMTGTETGVRQNVFKDAKLDAPFLMLLGDADAQARVPECVPPLEELKKAGADVDWHVYPKASHCFDCKSEDGKVATNGTQGTMTFIYNKAATDDAEARTFDFFASRMKTAQ